MLLDELLDYIEENCEIGFNKGTTDIQIALANVKLKQANIPTIPKDFALLLKHFNGLSNNGSIILGVNTGSPLFPDLVDLNIKIFAEEDETSLIILGYDEIFYLIYDDEEEIYRIIDKDDFEEETSTTKLTEIIPYLLKI
jgi:hypothetical protein